MASLVRGSTSVAGAGSSAVAGGVSGRCADGDTGALVDVLACVRGIGATFRAGFTCLFVGSTKENRFKYREM